MRREPAAGKLLKHAVGLRGRNIAPFGNPPAQHRHESPGEETHDELRRYRVSTRRHAGQFFPDRAPDSLSDLIVHGVAAIGKERCVKRAGCLRMLEHGQAEGEQAFVWNIR